MSKYKNVNIKDSSKRTSFINTILLAILLLYKWYFTVRRSICDMGYWNRPTKVYHNISRNSIVQANSKRFAFPKLLKMLFELQMWKNYGQFCFTLFCRNFLKFYCQSFTAAKSVQNFDNKKTKYVRFQYQIAS